MEKFDPREWAKTVKPRVVNKCQTCMMTEVKDATRAVLEVQATGKSRHISISMMWEKWVEQFKYPFSYSTFKGHVTSCEQELWRIIRGEKKETNGR